MGQSICFAEIRMENACNPYSQNSWVNRFVSPKYAWKMHQTLNLKIHGSIDLFRRNSHGKCIETLIIKFMGQSICFAELRMENASKTLISKFMGQSICFAKLHMENASKL